MAEVSRRQRAGHARAVTVVRALYGINLLWLAQSMTRWPRLLDVESIDPLWPVAWIDRDDPRTGLAIVFAVFAAATAWAAVTPQRRTARAAFALALLLLVGVLNGFGKVDHNLHVLLLVSTALIALPRDGWEASASVGARQTFLTVVWSAQALTLFTYGMTGLWKAFWAIRSAFEQSEPSMLSLDGFSVLLARRVETYSEDTLLADLVIPRPALGWALYLGTIYLELGAFAVITRPRLHRLWGFGLISFHLGTQALMGFTFMQNIVVLVLLLVLSPTAVEPVPVRRALGDLPGVLEARLLLRRRSRRRPDPAPA
jgi:hypothetical protein